MSRDASDGGVPKPYTLLGPDRRFYASERSGTLGGHRGTRIYGALDCPAALRAIARGGYVRHRVFFADEATAIAAGYRPCAVCCPQRFQAFKAARGAATKETGVHERDMPRRASGAHRGVQRRRPVDHHHVARH